MKKAYQIDERKAINRFRSYLTTNPGNIQLVLPLADLAQRPRSTREGWPVLEEFQRAPRRWRERGDFPPKQTRAVHKPGDEGLTLQRMSGARSGQRSGRASPPCGGVERRLRLCPARVSKFK